VQALNQIFSQLPPQFPAILVVQHMPPAFVDSLAEQLRKKTGYAVRVAQDGEVLTPSVILIAPGEAHLTVVRRQDRFICHHLEGPPMGYHKPAVNVLFNSAAKISGPDVLGVILTGMGEDGAEGMLNMKTRGCQTIGQDESSCVVYGMPRKAFERGAVGRQLPLTEIAEAIMRFAEGERS
jgi:two-component system chemotaxis response regulator CheB